MTSNIAQGSKTAPPPLAQYQQPGSLDQQRLEEALTKVLSNPGAWLAVSRGGTFVARLPRHFDVDRAKNETVPLPRASLRHRIKAWLVLNLKLAASGHDGGRNLAETHSLNRREQSSGLRYIIKRAPGDITTLGLSLAAQEAMSPSERARNRQQNSAAAQAFLAKMTAIDTPPEILGRLESKLLGSTTNSDKRTDVPLVELPPKVFASQLAVIHAQKARMTVHANLVRSLQTRMRQDFARAAEQEAANRNMARQQGRFVPSSASEEGSAHLAFGAASVKSPADQDRLMAAALKMWHAERTEEERAKGPAVRSDMRSSDDHYPKVLHFLNLEITKFTTERLREANRL
ncbi:hypothetical protein WG922_03830 [Ramlibacter sp. AN1015]|uniref:hypothetical protein n=1 Tax=Ramlibacter sp. AN1015 TaxID=3133428 RepID=UPI0030BFA833